MSSTANQPSASSFGKHHSSSTPAEPPDAPKSVRHVDATALAKRILDDPARVIPSGAVLVPMSGEVSGTPERGRIDRGRGLVGGGGPVRGAPSDSPTPANPGSETTPANGNGAVIAVANVHVLFWGDAWLSASTQPAMSDVTTALTALVSGPFLRDLKQYGVRHAQIADSYVVDLGLTSAPPVNFTQADCVTLISLLISEGILPALTDAGAYQEVFALLPPPVPDAPNSWGFTGFHNYGTNAQGRKIFYLVVNSSGSITNGITVGMSHELVECCTDPDFNEIKFSNSGENEICDVCEDQTGYVNGVEVQKYWSDSEKACVLPTQPSAVGPAGSDRVLNLSATITIKSGSGNPKLETYDFSRVVTVNNNQKSAVAIVTTPGVNTLSANIVLDFAWNADFSVDVNFSSAFFLGLNSITGYSNSFSLQPGYTEFYTVGHEIDNNTDTCAINFSVNNQLGGGGAL